VCGYDRAGLGPLVFGHSGDPYIARASLTETRRSGASVSPSKWTRYCSPLTGAVVGSASGRGLPSVCRSPGQDAISAAPVLGSCRAAEGASRNCTPATAISLLAVGAMVWPTRANLRARWTGASGEPGISECGSVAGRTFSNPFPIGRQGCTGRPIIACSARPRRRRSAGSVYSATICAGITHG
jgi:hypothetical protein